MTRNRIQHFAYVTIALAAVLSLALPAAAAAPVRAYIPFAFEAGEVALPAGHYVVRQQAGGGMVYLENRDKDETFVFGSLPAGDPSNPKPPCLLFERLGNGYRLAEVRLAGGGAAQALPRTEQQNLMAKAKGKLQRIEIALAY